VRPAETNFGGPPRTPPAPWQCGVPQRPTLGDSGEEPSPGIRGAWPHARHQRRRPGAPGRTPFPAGVATTSVGPWLGSHCGAGSGFTPTSSAARTASGPRVRTTRSAGGAGSARAPRSGTRRGSFPGDTLGGGGGRVSVLLTRPLTPRPPHRRVQLRDRSGGRRPERRAGSSTRRRPAD